jgi:hypothetical protein
MGPEITRIAWKLQSGLPQDLLAQKPALLMDCEEMFDELTLAPKATVVSTPKLDFLYHFRFMSRKFPR